MSFLSRLASTGGSLEHEEDVSYPISKHVRYWYRRIRYAPNRLRWRVGDFYVRGRRGWTDDDVDELDAYLARVIGEMLLRLAERNRGRPPDDKFKGSFDDWDEWLRRHGTAMLAYRKARNDRNAQYPDYVEAVRATLCEIAEFWEYLWV